MGVRLLDEHERRVVALDSDAPAASAPRASPLQPMRRRRRRWMRPLAVALIALGSLALADAVVTLVWQEPFSALYAKLRQDHLRGQLRAEERALPTPIEQRALQGLTSEGARISFLASSLQRRSPDGSAVGRIRIPRIGVNFVVVSGTSTAALQSGPGIYPETSFPGAGHTTAIAGHRTTYLAPFRHIDALRAGDRIQLEMPYAHFVYTVTGSAVVPPTAVRVAEADWGYPRLVLSACTPLFSAEKRILVFARLRHAGATRPGTASVSARRRSRAAQPPRGVSPAVLKAV